MSGLFTAAELGQYRTDGFVVVPGLVDEQDLARFDRRFEAIVNGDAPVSGAMNLMRDVMVVKGVVEAKSPVHAINKLLRFEDDPELFDYVRIPGLLDRVHELIGDEVWSIATNVFNKPPHVDGRHPFHQDLLYFRIRPAKGIVGVWTAMSETTRENGCLAVIPGSHQGELLRHGDPDWEYVNRGFLGIGDAAKGERHYVLMQPGDTLFFHPLLIHGSGHNRSGGFRRAISAHFAAGACEALDQNWRDAEFVRHVG